jgi:hypothetical protein
LRVTKLVQLYGWKKVSSSIEKVRRIQQVKNCNFDFARLIKGVPS